MLRILPLPSVLLLGALQGCGGSGGDSIDNTIVNPPSAPMDGISGRVASSISGGIISVTDASGEEVVVASGRTTSASGAYHLVFSEFAIDAGITPPLLVTLDGSDATAVCDYNGEGDSDCLARGGDFAAFGETYDLPSGFTLRGISPTFPDSSIEGDRTVVVNLTAASDLAARYALASANGGNLDADAVNLAAQQSLGLVEFVTGLSTQGININSIPVVDITATSTTSMQATPSTPSLAVALFGASLHGQVDTSIGNRANYRRVLDRVGSNVTSQANSQLRAASAFLSGMITPYLNVASTYQAGLGEPSAVIAGAIAAQQVAIPRLDTLGGSRSSIALPAKPDSNDPLDRSKTFSNRLAEAMGATLLVSSSASFAGTPAGAETVYQDQLALLNSLVSQEVRQTLVQLDSAIAEAQAAGETELTGTNVSGALGFDADTASMTTATSTSSNIQTGISVNITIADGSRTNPGGDGVWNASEITIAISQTLNDVTTQQLFNGALILDMKAGTSSADATRISYTGNLRATSALEFVGDITVTDPQPLGTSQTPGPKAGAYDGTFTFTGGSTVSLTGDLASQVSQYSVTSGNSSVVADLETLEITDMNATLNLDVDAAGNVTGGTLTAAGSSTGSLGNNGILDFSDGTATALPIPII